MKHRELRGGAGVAIALGPVAGFPSPSRGEVFDVETGRQAAIL
jgi:hypothetical protein